MMKHSTSYLIFKERLISSGRDKLDGYNPNLLNEIFDWEIDEVEKSIYNGFKYHDDTDLALFLPLLKNYDGMQELQNKLEIFKTPSDARINILLALYKVTKNKRYLDMILLDFNHMNHKESIVVDLSNLVENNDVYNSLIDIYITDYKSDNRITALCAILYRNGFLQYLNDINEFQENIELIKKFNVDTEEQRKEIVLENNW